MGQTSDMARALFVGSLSLLSVCLSQERGTGEPEQVPWDGRRRHGRTWLRPIQPLPITHSLLLSLTGLVRPLRVTVELA
jgi:hypothetical protein